MRLGGRRLSLSNAWTEGMGRGGNLGEKTELLESWWRRNLPLALLLVR